MFNLLFLNTELPEWVTDKVSLISIISIALIVLVLLLISMFYKKAPTKKLALMALCIATSFTLSFIKVKVSLYGGSITFLSMLPIIFFAYTYGFSYGLTAGFIYGILQFIESPYILTVATFSLDYILPFSSVMIAPLFKNIIKNKVVSLPLGVVAVYVLRITFHVLSGIIFYEFGYVYDGFPQGSAFIYSFVYNISYLLPDMIITIIGSIFLAKSKIDERLKLV